MSRIVLGPFNRVEGDLEVTLEVADGRVRSAQADSPMYRGFEQILHGKHPLDALFFVPRICGICSVAQSAASARALAQAMGLTPPENGRLAAELTLAVENLADHVSHFYLFFMPDFAREAYRGRAWFADIEARFKATRGTASADVLPARARFMETMGYLAGKWPHTLSLQPGGSSRPLEAAELLRLRGLLGEFRRFLEAVLFGDRLESLAALDSVAALQRWAATHAGSDFGRFLRIAEDLSLHELGRATDRYLCYGAYGDTVPAGVWDGAQHPLDLSAIREDVSHSRLGGEVLLPPSSGVTLPQPDKPGAYSWCKAPRLDGRVAEVGALARQLLAGQPLLHELVARHGGSVSARVTARMLEIAQVLPLMEEWLRDLCPGEPFCLDGELPQDASVVGTVEAARGSLGHWLEIRAGRIANYQIIAPTTWNFSPRDAAGTPGALEQALARLSWGSEADTLRVQHVVRSFDPCMVCTVH
jgi:hydrogenase large subunit